MALLRLAELAGLDASPRVEDCLANLDPSAPADYRELAALLANDWQLEKSARIGLAGGQGAGKSTLGRLIEAACSQFGLRACVLSLDDFYFSKAEREALASRIHPLFETRGPPGTHDIGRCASTLDALLGSSEVALPVFDKGSDERVGFRTAQGPFDLVLLEGWCVGARALDESDLERDWNTLESQEDESGTWRRAVNRALGNEYEPVWRTLDSLVYLEVPGLDAIRRWRLEQEAARPVEQRMNAEEVARFVQYFERISEGMLVDLPRRADWIVQLDDAHRVSGLRKRSA